MPKRLSLLGQKFNRLTVVEDLGNNNSGKSYWLCRCDCGNYTKVSGGDLRNNHIKSCGCLKKEVSSKSKHGLSHSRIWGKWRGMIRRCENPNHHQYKNYGGRGIKVCDEWHSLEKFAEWAFSKGFDDSKGRYDCTLDRIDVNGDYCPENCRWISTKENCNNKTNNLWLEYNGERHTLQEWSDITGVKRSTIKYRITHGWPIKDALLLEPEYAYRTRREINERN